MLLDKVWSKGISYPTVPRGKLPPLVGLTADVRVKMGGEDARRCQAFKYQPMLYDRLRVALDWRLVRRLAERRDSLHVMFVRQTFCTSKGRAIRSCTS